MQINKWDAVYIGPQFGLKISGVGGTSVWFENKRGGGGGGAGLVVDP